MSFKAVQDRVIIIEDKAETVTTTGIVLTDAAAEKPAQGTVIAVGPGRKTKEDVIIAPEVKVGDKVLYYRGAGSKAKLEGEQVLILKEEEIYAVLED